MIHFSEGEIVACQKFHPMRFPLYREDVMTIYQWQVNTNINDGISTSKKKSAIIYFFRYSLYSVHGEATPRVLAVALLKQQECSNKRADICHLILLDASTYFKSTEFL